MRNPGNPLRVFQVLAAIVWQHDLACQVQKEDPMTHQAHSLEELRPCPTSRRTFFARFGYLGTCVLPAEALDDSPLSDPETGLPQPSLRQRCSQDGQLCFARVLSSYAEGLYWADVAATPDLVEAEHVVLTETHLTYALAWDERLSWQTPLQIRRLMQANARELVPLSLRREPEPAAALLPAPVVPLTVVTTVEVTTDELREAFETKASNDLSDAPNQSDKRLPTSANAVQHGLLRALSRALQELLETATDRFTAEVLQALTALVRRVERWQQQTRQRVINAVLAWNAASSGPAWALTLGVPEVLLGEA